MTKIVGSMTRGQSHEICNQIENACKEQNVNPEEIASELIRTNFFEEKIEEYLLSKNKQEESFIVGQVFQHRVEGLIPQYFYDNFRNWLWTPAKEKVVSINAFGKNNLKEYVLPRNMNDTAIQNANNSKPMEEDAFWSMLYLLIINPKLGKKILKYELRKDKAYIFHVKLVSGKVVAVFVGWNGDGWDLCACDFDGIRPWSVGRVFLYPVAA